MKGHISFKARLLMGFGAIIVLMIILMTMALMQFFNARTGLMELRDVVSPKAWEAEKMALDIVQVQQFLTDVSATHDTEGYQDAEEYAKDFKKTIEQFHKTKLTATEVNELASIDQAFDEYYQVGKRMAEAYIASGTEAGNLLMEEFDKSSLVLAGRMSKFREAAVGQSDSITNQITEETAETASFMLVLVTIGTVVSALIAFYLTQLLAKQLGIDPFYAKGLALEIAKGELGRIIEIDAADNNSLLYAMKKMQQEIVLRITSAQQLIDEVTRIKIALDNVSTGVMIAGNDRKIIYVNKAIIKLLKNIEPEIKRQSPDFSIDKIIGTKIDVFDKAPVHQRETVKTSKEVVKSNLVLGGHQFVLTTNPVIDEENRRLGTAAEWLDRTQELRVEDEVANAIEAAVAGNFNFRINDTGELGGFYEQASTGINQLMQICNDGLSDVARVLGAMAQGDLTETITNEYSGTFGLLKDNANTTAAKLKDIISQIKDVSDNINTGSKEIASGNNDLSHRTEEQAASLEQTAASMHELTATVQHNFENAKRANDLAINAAKIAGKGGDVVNQVVITMEEINHSSRKIVDIISVIDGIAFQTNILALNAAVEAARAGEQGRGFAVVASEVRNLAQRAAAAAGEIKNLIGDSVDKVEEGTQLVGHAGKTMTEILDSIKGVTAMMSSIAKASEEQGTGIAQVNMAISQMDDVTQQNAALVEEAAAAAESLEEQAKGLAVMVGTFKVGSTANNSGYSLKGKHEALRPSTKLPVAISLSDSEWEEF